MSKRRHSCPLKLAVVVPPGLYVQLKERAMYEEVSMSWIVRVSVSEYLLTHTRNISRPPRKRLPAEKP